MGGALLRSSPLNQENVFCGEDEGKIEDIFVANMVNENIIE